MPSILDLDTCPAMRVFRCVEKIFKDDANLATVVRSDSWKSWQGTPNDRAPLPTGRQVAIRLTPSNSKDAPWSPDAITEPVSIYVDMQIQTSAVDDVYNLWHAFKRALYPPDDATLDNPTDPRNLIILRLQDAGAEDGIATFAGPNIAESKESIEGGYLVARGVVFIDAINVLSA